MHVEPLQFVEVDPGFARIYYRTGKQLYCFQQDTPRYNRWNLYACTRDGEPHSLAVRSRLIDQLPVPVHLPTVQHFTLWAQDLGLVK
jgi:hypothetical protein